VTGQSEVARGAIPGCRYGWACSEASVRVGHEIQVIGSRLTPR
jgi:hypothetical protein